VPKDCAQRNVDRIALTLANDLELSVYLHVVGTGVATILVNFFQDRTRGESLRPAQLDPLGISTERQPARQRIHESLRISHLAIELVPAFARKLGGQFGDSGRISA